MSQTKKRISLDRSKLLGFKLDAAQPTAKAGTKVGPKFGSKPGIRRAAKR